jgi:subtilisin family serine protease
MRKRSYFWVSAFAAMALTACVMGDDELAEGQYATGGNPFRNVTSTADGYTTWDSDMIDIEAVSETGAGVYVAVLDTGLVPNWRDYFPKARIATELGIGFEQPIAVTSMFGYPCGLAFAMGKLHETSWVGSLGSSHGTHVTSTILGYFYDNNYDTLAGYPLPPIMVRGIAPEVTIIPVKVLTDVQIPALPQCGPGYPASHEVFGTDEMVAAGIDYVTDLAIAGYRPMVINMSLGGPELAPVEQAALDRAVANGVIVVASAGNEGEDGMGYPGAYEPVISVGSTGWTGEWLFPWQQPYYRMWWLQSDLLPYGDLGEPTPVDEVYVSDFSSRELEGQDLDVLAPGSWVRGPMPGDPGYAHMPWWAKGWGDVVGANPGNFYFAGGTSMASPHVAALAALLLERNPALTAAEVETILTSTAKPISAGDAMVFDLYEWDFITESWGADAVGAGLVQASEALAAATPIP